MKKVVKFGGSSLASAGQFKKVGDIIHADCARRYVVPSARESVFRRIQRLRICCMTVTAPLSPGKDFSQKLKNIKDRYQEIIDGLSLTLSLDSEFDKIEEQFRAGAGEDYAASRGEYLNGIVMAAYLGCTYIDAAEVIFFDENGNFLAEKTDQVLSERLEKEERAVIPGFYGSKPDGSVKTFSRGGSDITGYHRRKGGTCRRVRKLDRCFRVPGDGSADCENPEVISTITYRELRELSYMGATVLHEDCIFPLRKEGIPIHVLNTNAPQDPGTLIVESTCSKPRFTITGIAGKKGFAAITIEKSMMNSEVGFGRKYCRCLRKMIFPLNMCRPASIQ